MKASSILITLLFSACLSTSAQRALTKEEIFQFQMQSYLKKQLPKDSIKLTWSDELNIKLRERMASLKKTGIDSLIVYSVSSPGYAFRLDSCSSKYGTSAYLIWKGHGKVTIEKYKGECCSIIENDRSRDIFDFYDAHQSKLKDEIFMPVIYNAQTNSNNEITYSISMTFHEPKYSLYFEVSSGYNSFTFGESELSDENSVFYNYNLDLAAYHLWKLISGQVRK